MNILERFKFDILIVGCLALLNIFFLDFIGVASGNLLVIVPIGLIMGALMLVVYKVVKKLRKLLKKKKKKDKLIREEYLQECISRVVEIVEIPVILVDEELKTIEANDSAREHFKSIDIGVDILDVIQDKAFIEAMTKVKLEPHELFVEFMDNQSEYNASISPIQYDEDIYHYLIKCKNLAQKRSKSEINRDHLIHHQIKIAKAVQEATSKIHDLADDISDKSRSASIQSDVIGIKQNTVAIEQVVQSSISIKNTNHVHMVVSKNSISDILNGGKSKSYKKRIKKERDEEDKYREL